MIRKSISLKYSIVIVTLLTLYGCATPEKKKTDTTTPTSAIETVEVIEDSTDSEITAEDLVEQASSEDNEQAIVLLLQATNKYIQQQQLDKALSMALELRKLSLTNAQENYNQLNISEVLFEIGEIELASQELSKVNTQTVSKRQLFLQANINVQTGMLINGIIDYLNYHQQYPITAEDEAFYLATLFAKLKPYQVTALSKRKALHLEGWLAYTSSLSEYGNADDITNQLATWQSKFPEHPANLLIANVQQQAITLEQDAEFETVSVLIPLSGREKTLGETIQAGIMAAYQQKSKVQLNFIDTNATNMSDIVANLHQQKPSFVIGPLLKQHVESYLASTHDETAFDEGSVEMTTISAENNNPFTESEAITESAQSSDQLSLQEQLTLPHQWPTLLLNLPEQNVLNKNQFALSMLPEDEARQAAFSLSQKGYQQAMVLSQNSTIGKRMAKSFADEWQKYHHTQVNIIYYPNGKEMQTAVKRGLEVNLSDERIYLMRNRISENVKAEARNRRDVDMIYIFGTPDQARLIKPYVDVNISPFAESIDLFASSRSHNDKLDANTRRDLTGLTFTEIPWLLSSRQANPELAEQSKQLWPQRSSSLERIYAMGIDSFQLLEKLRAMQLIPMIKHQGEIGTLQMDEQGIISRSVDWGKYRSSRVQPIVIN
ncbi:penicillin-binding protein activator [Thalassotalea crassostreae]|uniref:penicillin-binding protein activator n=1 Tax=Thalassotalea crassostreae TaxID=1763536 RepID=UPI00083876D9|nr:penicillin-binding protein activator [Thalassotalea crassostreae]